MLSTRCSHPNNVLLDLGARTMCRIPVRVGNLRNEEQWCRVRSGDETQQPRQVLESVLGNETESTCAATRSRDELACTVRQYCKIAPHKLCPTETTTTQETSLYAATQCTMAFLAAPCATRHWSELTNRLSRGSVTPANRFSSCRRLSS